MEDRLIRVEKAIENMANGITKLTEAIGDVIKDNAVRNERDKRQEEKHKELSDEVVIIGERMQSNADAINKKVNDFIESYKEHDKPVVDTSRKWQAASFWWVTRFLLPIVIVAVLLSAGINIYGDAKPSPKQESTKANQ